MSYKSEYMKKYNLLNKDRLKADRKKYYQDNKDKINAKQKEYNRLNKEKVNKNNRANSRKPSTRFSAARSGAKKRNLIFDIPKEVYLQMIQEPCTYCNDFFERSITGVGLDRIDNSIGYTFENCLPCCTTCNKMRNEFLTVDETRAIVSLIIKMRTEV